MVARKLELGRSPSNRPVPISVWIQAANNFGCDIYIRMDNSKVDVKCYEEMQRLCCTQKGNTVVYFDGADEQEAEVKFRQIEGSSA